MKTEILSLLKANLKDIRMANVRLQLEDLIERKLFGSPDEQYRLMLGTPASAITSIEDLCLKLMLADVEVTPYTGGGSTYSDKLGTILVTLHNVILAPFNYYDASLTSYHGRANTLNFIMGYAGDNDPDLPLKILGMVLTTDVKPEVVVEAE